jgi:serine phosphatase RsbU (regulator of sigma subunit)
MLFTYTDGVVDALSTDGVRFSQERLFALLTQQTAGASELIKRIKSAIFAHIGSKPLEDDITILALQHKHD